DPPRRELQRVFERVRQSGGEQRGVARDYVSFVGDLKVDALSRVEWQRVDCFLDEVRQGEVFGCGELLIGAGEHEQALYQERKARSDPSGAEHLVAARALCLERKVELA